MDKFKYLFLILIILATLLIGTKPFLNFMEEQNDILQISSLKYENIIEENSVNNLINDVSTDNINNSNIINDIIIKEEKEEEKKVEVTNRGNKDVSTTTNSTNKSTSNNSDTNKDSSDKIDNKKTESKETNYFAVEATGYCPCISCCGKTNGITASGKKAQANHTIAASSKYSFGTKIEIKGYGTYVVEDRGGAITGDRIDIFFNTHQEALNWGRRTVYIKIIE